MTTNVNSQTKMTKMKLIDQNDNRPN